MEIRDSLPLRLPAPTLLPVDVSERGILYPARLPTFRRVEPPAAAADLVRWFWIPEWDLAPGRSSRQHVIAFPACNLVVESGLDSRVGFAGPTTRASHRDLVGRGWAVGALLQPAAVPALTVDPVADRDQYRALELPDLQGPVAAAMAPGGRERPDRYARAVDAFAGWLLGHVGPPDEEALLANRLAALIESDSTVLRLEQAAELLYVSPRTVQRLARKYVGLPPATMIRRRRLQEAAGRVRDDPTTDLSALAATLGYSDRAHLANDFRSTLGLTASAYRADSQESLPFHPPSTPPVDDA